MATRDSMAKKKGKREALNGNGIKPAKSAGDLLKDDHREVEQLFAQFERAGNRQEQTRLVKDICGKLAMHTALEEEIFYPECRRHGVDEQKLDAAQVEHDTVKLFLRELKDQKPGAPFHAAKVKVLSELVTHHVQEEEKPDGLFAMAGEKGVDLEELGRRIQERKQQLTEEADESGAEVPPLRALTALGLGSQQQEQGTMNRDYGYGRGGYGGRYEHEEERSSRQGYGGTQRTGTRGMSQDDDEFGQTDWQQQRGSQGQGRFGQGQRGRQGQQGQQWGQSQYERSGMGQGRFGQGQGGYGSSGMEREGGYGGRGGYGQQGQGRFGQGQEEFGQYGQRRSGQGRQGQGRFGQGGYGQQQYGQGQYGQEYFGQEQFGQDQYGQGQHRGGRNDFEDENQSRFGQYGNDDYRRTPHFDDQDEDMETGRYRGRRSAYD